MWFLPVFLALLVLVPAYAQEIKNPSITVDLIEIPAGEFNIVGRDSSTVSLNHTHTVSWQATIDNNLVYENPLGNAVIRIHDTEEDKFIEIGMGSIPEKKFWIAVQIPGDEGYVIVHSKTERGWHPEAKTIVSYTDRAGMTINNGERIVVSNLDIGDFAVGSYSVFGMESSTDPPAINSGSMTVELLSGDPGKNVFAFFPFYVTAAVGVLVAALFLVKKRS